MSSISSLTKAMSGLNAAQKGLQVTSHNLSNIHTQGYTRQNLLQSESPYLTVGNKGGYLMQVGLGVSTDEIRQIRDSLIDKRLRTETSVLNYYQTLNTTINDIQTVFDEPYGDTLSDMLNTFWAQTNKLSNNPTGVEERLSFISTAQTLAEKLNSVSKTLEDCQDNVNEQVITSVERINTIITKISEYNELITTAECNGDKANDYRDQRNLLLDELAQYGDVSYSENNDGQLLVQFEGHTVVDKNLTAQMRLEQAEVKSPFVKPVWADTNTDVYTFKDRITTLAETDTGKLKALLVARGNNYASERTTWDDIAFNDNLSVDEIGNSFVIPLIQKKLDAFAGKLAEIVNTSLNGTGTGDHKGQVGEKVFVADGGTKITAGNITINAELTTDGGYNKLGVIAHDPSVSGPDLDDESNNVSDNSTVDNLIKAWEAEINWYGEDAGNSAPTPKEVNIKTFFTDFVTSVGTHGSNYIAKTNEKNMSVNSITNERLSMSSVSQDEEFTYMLKYQYAYNASARMITMLDSMLDTIINKM